MEIFVDPVYCAFGDIQGAASSNESFDMNNINSLFNMSDEEKNGLTSLSEELNLAELDLNI